MRALESRLNAIWYAGSPAPWILRMLARCYAWVYTLRRPATASRLSVPVVVVGNFTVGGTGKTPLLIALVEYLKKAGYTPGVVSRGYGRSGSGPLSVVAESQALNAGDEPLLIARRCHIPVRVDINRRRAAEYLLTAGCNIIVSDDGLQHHRLPRLLEIEVVDSARGYGNGQLLPAGPLREWPRQVDLRVCNGQIGDNETAFGMWLQAGLCRNLQTGELRELSEFRGQDVHAVAGIGNPERFFRLLLQFGIRIQAHAFSDHHRFLPEDLPAGVLLMTEKDAVKLQVPGRDDLWAVTVDAQLSAAFYSQFSQLLAPDGGAHA